LGRFCSSEAIPYGLIQNSGPTCHHGELGGYEEAVYDHEDRNRQQGDKDHFVSRSG
jgi:hypothetical protein